jgi:hypothetical protein
MPRRKIPNDFTKKINEIKITSDEGWAQKILTNDPLPFLEQFAFSEEKKSICQFMNTGVTIAGKSLNFS